MVEAMTSTSLRVHRAIVTAAVVAAILATCPRSSGVAAAEQVDEYRVKAAMLVTFSKFVAWNHTPPIAICTVGADRALESMLLAHASPTLLISTHANAHDDMAHCDVLFIGDSVGRDTSYVLASLMNTPVLTIGESDPFLNEGGIVRLFLEANHIRFDINRRASEAHGLKISSQLLSLAAK